MCGEFFSMNETLITSTASPLRLSVLFGKNRNTDINEPDSRVDSNKEKSLEEFEMSWFWLRSSAF